MKVHDARRGNLIWLIERFYAASQANLARALGVAPSYVNQLVKGAGAEGGRNIGASTARKLERLRGLPDGWFDVPHQGDAEGRSQEPLSSMESQLVAMFKRLSPEAQESVLGRTQKLFLAERPAAYPGIEFGPTVFEADVRERHEVRKTAPRGRRARTSLK